MTENTDLKGLVEELEKAEEGSRDLDDKILERMYQNQATLEGYGKVMVFEDYICVHQEPHFRKPVNIPRPLNDHYTTSIDTALALVPEDYEVKLLRGEDYATARLNHLKMRYGSGQCNGRTLPLAICIAALKARIGEEG